METRSMKILYVAKHDSGGNDDEGAIAQSLSSLGHDIERLHENNGRQAIGVKADLCLFHKWLDVTTIRQVKIPKAFWYFDLVNYCDPTIKARCESRIRWMIDVVPHVQFGLLTDGEWVSTDRSGKLVWLTQGADQRNVGRGDCWSPSHAESPILFTGTRRGGAVRESFVDEMKTRYGRKFRHIESGIYGRALANLIAASKIVVAPDGPIAPTYWSNRVYTALGFGAFLLHPWCNLSYQYEDGKEIVYYRSREHLHELIAHYLDCPGERRQIADAGLARTVASHTYTHRSVELMRIVKERLL